MNADEVHKMAAVEASHWWYVGTREICLALLRPHIGGRQPLRILDIGCGTGGNLAELARLGPARGIDLDPLCVDYTRRRGLECSLGNMLDFEVPPSVARSDHVLRRGDAPGPRPVSGSARAHGRRARAGRRARVSGAGDAGSAGIP